MPVLRFLGTGHLSTGSSGEQGGRRHRTSTGQAGMCWQTTFPCTGAISPRDSQRSRQTLSSGKGVGGTVFLQVIRSSSCCWAYCISSYLSVSITVPCSKLYLFGLEIREKWFMRKFNILKSSKYEILIQKNGQLLSASWFRSFQFFWSFRRCVQRGE